MSKTIVLILLLVAVTLSVQGADGPKKYDLADAKKLFEKYIKDFNKVYKDDNDNEIHFEQFKKNLIEINDLNEKNYPTTKFDINQFTDLNREEWKKHLGLLIPNLVKESKFFLTFLFKISQFFIITLLGFACTLKHNVIKNAHFFGVLKLRTNLIILQGTSDLISWWSQPVIGPSTLTTALTIIKSSLTMQVVGLTGHSDLNKNTRRTILQCCG